MSHCKTLAAALLLLVASPAAAVLIPVSEAIEALTLIVDVRADGRGQVSGRECDDCPLRRFRVSPQTRYSADGQPVGVAELRARNGQPATIIYNLESGLATRVLW